MNENKADIKLPEMVNQKKNWHDTFKIIEYFKKQLPQGGEMELDGYIDALYVDTRSGETYRFVERDIIDCGKFAYPKRLEEYCSKKFSDNWFTKFTPIEKELHGWIIEFGLLPSTRM